MVDWFHATEHLAGAAKVWKSENTLTAKRWLNAQKTTLFEGHADRIARELSVAAPHCTSAVAEALEKEVGCFRKNQYRMRYQEMRVDGWRLAAAW